MRLHISGFMERIFLMKHLLLPLLTFKSLVEHLEYPLAVQVNKALYRPIRKGLERLEERSYISIYQDEASHSKALLKLPKIDFNLLQSLPKKELSHITRLVLKSCNHKNRKYLEKKKKH